jgi:RNA polymerase sigma-70 factor (ECF subfamily)
MNNLYNYSTDFALWQDFKSGSKEAYSFIYRRYATVLYNYGYKICQDKQLTEDCLQDLFIHILLHKQQLSDTTSIKYYLFKALRREIISKLASAQKHIHAGEMNVPFECAIECSLPSHESDIIEKQIGKEQTEALAKEINNLPARQKEAVFLKFYDELSYEEIASIMEIDHKSVYKTIYKAIDTLQKKLPYETWLALLIITSW